MNVLSIDIDFFVEPVAHSRPFGSVERLDAGEYAVDDEASVTQLLERCGLSPGARVPGVFIRHHHQAFDVLAIACASEQATAVLTHVDAHSDLGMGDSGYVYLATELVHLTIDERRRPRRGDEQMNEANWLAFAVAAGLVSDVTFVPRTMPTALKHDLHPWHVSGAGDEIVVRRATKHEKDLISYGQRELLKTVPVVARAPLSIRDHHDFCASAPPDLVIVCQSPQFTPAAADRVLEQCQSRMAADPRFALEAPVGWPIDADRAG